MATEKIRSHPNIEVIPGEVTDIPEDGITVIASGPLTSDALAEKIAALCGGGLSFFDAAAPIVTRESLDMEHCFSASRYDKGDDDYINCPMNKEEYEAFYEALVSAERAPVHDFDVMNPKVYEGCMPIEVMAQRGHDTIRFGPLKPVGLRDPRTGHRPWAVVQLRTENAERTLYNLVGFQTNLTFPEQKKVFSVIPALKNAEYARYGVMHRNTFINSPEVLNPDYSLKNHPKTFFAGQITGVEGYVESAMSGLLAGIHLLRKIKGLEYLPLPEGTVMGALTKYITTQNQDFQPMNANFGILPSLNCIVRDKKERKRQMAERSLTQITAYKKEI
jgi:methylenetetrahydrofolate--tRNA-(uracil-5-)-methyltransferase